MSEANRSARREDGGKQVESKLRLPVACGTNSGYQKHIRDRTPLCVPCRMAPLRTRASTTGAGHSCQRCLCRWVRLRYPGKSLQFAKCLGKAGERHYETRVVLSRAGHL